MGWIQCDHLHDEVESVLLELVEERCWGLWTELWERGLEVLEFANSNPIHLTRCPMQLEDLENLVDL